MKTNYADIPEILGIIHWKKVEILGKLGIIIKMENRKTFPLYSLFWSLGGGGLGAGIVSVL